VKETLIFFVNDEAASKELRRLNNTITTRHGNIAIITKPSDPPRGHDGRSEGSSGGNAGGAGAAKFSRPARNFGETETDPDKISTLKEFLSTRYDAASVKLDLTNLGGDRILRGAQIDTRIWQPKLMNTILLLVNELCPNLKSLDISNNRLQRLDILANLSDKCPQLEELNLSQNQIRNLNELSKVSDCKTLIKLWFSDNPAKENYDNNDSGYVSAIRQYLPDVKELDGVALPPPIKFVETTNNANLPKTQKMYTCNKEVLDLVVNFLKSFFGIYDSEDTNDRQELLQAYHNDAVFSICAHNTISNKEKVKGLNDYFESSRNLSVIKDNNKKISLIKNKKLSVVALLTELPSTKHQFDTFHFDVSVVTSSCLMFTVYGIFLEGKESIPRGFARSFIAVPQSSSKFLIVNDQLHIRQITDKQIQSFSSPSSSSIATNTNGNGVTGLTSEQQILLEKFSSQSGMNMKYSLDCLSNYSWNFEVAASKFTELKKNGAIPADAFIKK